MLLLFKATEHQLIRGVPTLTQVGRFIEELEMMWLSAGPSLRLAISIQELLSLDGVEECQGCKTTTQLLAVECMHPKFQQDGSEGFLEMVFGDMFRYVSTKDLHLGLSGCRIRELFKLTWTMWVVVVVNNESADTDHILLFRSIH